MSLNHSYREIATDYALWIEFVDTDAAMTEDEFNATSTDRKIALQVEMFGEEKVMATVLLASGTVGTTTAEASVGDTVTVSLHDENGAPITETGVVEEVLEA